MARTQSPLPIQLMRDYGQLDKYQEHRGVIVNNGRVFLAALLSLPLHWPESPATTQVWIEGTVRHLDNLRELANGGQPFSGRGRLACDVPGFPGTIGSAVTFMVQPGNALPQIRACADERISSIRDPSHEQLVDLYRRTWGNTEPVPEANHLRRRAVEDHIATLLGRPHFRRAVMPPARFAGITPAEMLSAPPLDTGDEAVLATIGASDTSQPGIPLAEALVWARNPGDDFGRSFSEFCYASRLPSTKMYGGSVIHERQPIPETDGMLGWLFSVPWWEEGWPEAIDAAGSAVHLLAAIPVHGTEIAFAVTHGGPALADRLRDDDVDIADLGRSPAMNRAV